MGTNYYVRPKTETCPTCGHIDGDDEIHIGKSSMGWRFCFSHREDLGLTSKAQWSTFLNQSDGYIFDEYGSNTSAELLIALIERKQQTPGNRSHGEYDATTDAEGYDFYKGEFS